MEMVLSAHSGLRWLVVLGLVAVIAWGLGKGKEADLPGWVALVGWVLRIQVVLGLVLYLANSGWEMGSFIAYWHPLGMLVALGAFEAGSGRARRQRLPRVLALFTIVALLLILSAVPWDRGMF